jgi:hypothetical protein
MTTSIPPSLLMSPNAAPRPFAIKGRAVPPRGADFFKASVGPAAHQQVWFGVRIRREAFGLEPNAAVGLGAALTASIRSRTRAAASGSMAGISAMSSGTGPRARIGNHAAIPTAMATAMAALTATRRWDTNRPNALQCRRH